MDETSNAGVSWDIHEASAPYESDRWASSDRGWLHGCPCHGCTTSLGHYLDYTGTSEDGRRPEGNVHAVLIAHVAHRPGPYGAQCSTRTSAVRWFRTSAEARAWLESESTGQQTLAV